MNNLIRSLLLLLLMIFIIGCEGGPPINLTIAEPHRDDDNMSVVYSYAQDLGIYGDTRWNLMGRQDTKMAYVIHDLWHREYPNSLVVDVWMANISEDPITFRIDGFKILTPSGKTYSVDKDYQDVAARTGGVGPGYMTLQPEQQLRTRLYYNINNIALNDLRWWRFGYDSDGYLTNFFGGFFSGFFLEQRYVWLYPAYATEPAN